MNYWPLLGIALVVIGFVALAAIIFVPPSLTKPDDKLAADWEPAAGEGQYVTQMADWPDRQSLDETGLITLTSRYYRPLNPSLPRR